jgi:hypothetical protein
MEEEFILAMLVEDFVIWVASIVIIVSYFIYALIFK